MTNPFLFNYSYVYAFIFKYFESESFLDLL